MNENERTKQEFLEIATAAINRRFSVCPVHPSEKRGVLWNQYSHPATNLSEIMALSKDFPTHNVGVVGKCIPGHVTIFDVDAQGVLERFESETKTTVPETYVVQSQSKNKPWKKHFYFRHTAYSYQTLGGSKATEINVKDWNGIPDDRGVYPTLFDLKGAGHGGYVVAEGSTHPSGEIYTGNGVTICAPIPDALVDWIIKERTHARSEAAKLRESVKKKLTEARALGTQSEFSKDMIRIAIKSRIGKFVRLGVRKLDIVRLVQRQIEDFMIDGKRLAQEWEDYIRKELNNPGWKWGVLSEEWLPRPDSKRTKIKEIQEENMKGTTKNRLVIVEEVIVTLHKFVKMSEVRQQVEKALFGSGLTLSRNRVGDRVLRRALQRYGYRPIGGGADRTWELWV